MVNEDGEKLGVLEVMEVKRGRYFLKGEKLVSLDGIRWELKKLLDSIVWKWWKILINVVLVKWG